MRNLFPHALPTLWHAWAIVTDPVLAATCDDGTRRAAWVALKLERSQHRQAPARSHQPGDAA